MDAASSAEAPTGPQHRIANVTRLSHPAADEVVTSASKPSYAEADEAELRDWIESRGAAVRSGVEGEMAKRAKFEIAEAYTTPQNGFDRGEIPFPTPSWTPDQTVADQVLAEPSPSAIATPQMGNCLQQPSDQIPLARVFPAGTVVIRGHAIVADGVDKLVVEDGWLDFSVDMLVKSVHYDRSVSWEESQDQGLHIAFPTVQLSPSPSPSKKRRRSSAASQRGAKRNKPDLDPLVELVVANSAARTARATAAQVGDDVVLRIYLIPQDLEELSDPTYRGRSRKPVGTTVLNLLAAVRVSQMEWMGEVDPAEPVAFLRESDMRSLLEVYRDVESPAHDPAFVEDLDTCANVRERIVAALADGAPGITTELFEYQRATLAKMLARELAPQQIALPSFIRRSTILDSPARDIFVCTDGRICLEPATVQEPRGGILAEDMGVGKTLIALALVLSTLSELPRLDGTSTYLDGSSPSPAPYLLTRVSTDFPFASEMAETRKTRRRVPAPLPGFVLDAKEQRAYDDALRRQAAEDSVLPTLPFPSLRSLMLNYVKTTSVAQRYPRPTEEPDSPLPPAMFDELQASPPFYRLFPSADQEDSREGRRGTLKPLHIVVAATTLIVVPTDLVRQWEAQISEHVAPGALRTLVLRTSKDKFRSAAEMATYDLILMSVARFADAAELTENSLRGVHWKRLVIDEGHVLAHENRMRKLAQELRTESRWAVSGTPSTNLRVSDDTDTVAVGGDRIDYDRLGQLFSRFLQHAAFPRPETLRKIVQTHVADNGERPSRLAGSFDRAIMRHRPEHVRLAFSLPPITRRVVEVAMEECERKIYNALIATFVSNAITSQRVDVDYLFHPSKSGPLNLLCDNLAAATTFFGSSEFYSFAFDARKFAKEVLAGTKSLAWTDDEREKEHKVVSVLTEVLEDRESLLTAGEPSIAFEVFGLPEELLATFRGLRADQSPLNRTLMSANELVRLRVNLKELRHADVKAWSDDEELVEELITFEEKRKRIDARPKSYKPDEDEQPLFKKRPKNSKVELVPLPTDSIFRNIKLGACTSAKFNHIIGELKRYPDEKFIIFSSSKIDLLFANLSEALDLLSICHKIFAGGHTRGGDRGGTAQYFNKTSAAECQAILVDAKLGGRGMNLTAASRVIMLEPIWQPDLELQAEKRAHRLGQTKPVNLQILVVPGTFEHALLSRRGQLAREDFVKKIKAPQQDNELRSLLHESRYLEPAPQAREGMPVSDCHWGLVKLFPNLDS